MRASILSSSRPTAAAAIALTTTTIAQATPATAQRALTALHRAYSRVAVRIVTALAGASEARATGAEAAGTTAADVGPFTGESIWCGLQLRVGAIQSLGAIAAREAGGLVSQQDEDGRVIAIAGMDCSADPASGEVIVNSEALASIQRAEVALDDALVTVRLTRPGSRTARWAGDHSAALAALARAQEAAEVATPRAARLADDLARLPGLLHLARKGAYTCLRTA